MLPDDSFIVKLLCIYRFYPDSIARLMNLMTLFFEKHMVCPTTGSRVPIRSIAMPDNRERNGLEKLPIWWHCQHCDEWHIFRLYRIKVKAAPS